MSVFCYDMYCKLIEETLREVQGIQTLQKPLETRVELRVDAYLPDDYIQDEKQRIEMYKRISTVATDDDCRILEDELLDRFGQHPLMVDSLLDVAQTRNLANQFVWTTGSASLQTNFRVIDLPPMLLPVFLPHRKPAIPQG